MGYSYMTANEILEKVRLTFNELVNPKQINAAAPDASTAPAAPMMTDYKTKDGATLSIDKLEVGGVVMVDGNPANPGEYTLEDGTMITVADNGVIAEVAAATEEVVDPTEDMGAKFSAFEAVTNEKFAAYENKFAAYEAKFADYEGKMAKANGVIEQLLNLSQLLVEAPKADPDPSVKNTGAFKEEKKKQSFDILFT